MSDPDALLDESFVGERSPATYTVEIDGEAVVLDEDSDRLHHLNTTAALFWHCLDGRAAIAEICDEIAHELQLPAEAVRADCVAIARTFAAEGLVHDAAASASGEQWVRRQDVLWRRSLDSIVVLPVGAEEPLVLSATGPAIWDLLASPITLSTVVDTLTTTYAAERAQIEADAREWLARLTDAGVCDQVEPSPRR